MTLHMLKKIKNKIVIITSDLQWYWFFFFPKYFVIKKVYAGRLSQMECRISQEIPTFVICSWPSSSMSPGVQYFLLLCFLSIRIFSTDNNMTVTISKKKKKVNKEKQFLIKEKKLYDIRILKNGQLSCW